MMRIIYRVECFASGKECLCVGVEGYESGVFEVRFLEGITLMRCDRIQEFFGDFGDVLCVEGLVPEY